MGKYAGGGLIPKKEFQLCKTKLWFYAKMSFLHVQRGFRSWRLSVLNVGLPSFQKKKTFFQSLSSLVSVIRFSLSLCVATSVSVTLICLFVSQFFRLSCSHLLLCEFSTFYQLFNIYEWVDGGVCLRTHALAGVCNMSSDWRYRLPLSPTPHTSSTMIRCKREFHFAEN